MVFPVVVALADCSAGGNPVTLKAANPRVLLKKCFQTTEVNGADRGRTYG
jgi:hypothetical protein